MHRPKGARDAAARPRPHREGPRAVRGAAQAGREQGEGRPHCEHEPALGGEEGRQVRSYEDWSKDDLQKRAREIGIEGRSKMSKAELVKALRDH
jgi:hypothetical protein